jgi:hypothetical protein
MPYLVTDDSPRVFMADKGYVSTDLEEDLRSDCGHQLLALRRRNQKIQWHPGLRHIVKTLRCWVETAGSVLDSAYNFVFVLVAVLLSWLDY